MFQTAILKANEDIQQIVEVFSAGPQRFPWMLGRLVGMCAGIL